MWVVATLLLRDWWYLIITTNTIKNNNFILEDTAPVNTGEGKFGYCINVYKCDNIHRNVGINTNTNFIQVVLTTARLGSPLID